MEADGCWSKPGPGYQPKYFGTVWSVIQLAQLGGSLHEDKRIQKACHYVRAHALVPAGQFSYNGAPSGTFDCLQGNLCAALLQLGCDPTELAPALDWMARSQTGNGIAPASDRDAPVRYYAYKSGPDYACGANNKLPCAWGAVKVMLAFGAIPKVHRTAVVREAIHKGVDFLLGVDPAKAAYPTGSGGAPNRSWWKFGFPVFYISDILQIVEALTALGYGGDKRLRHAVSLVEEKQNPNGQWPLEYEYSGKTWVKFGRKNAPNKWVTLRAVRALQRI